MTYFCEFSNADAKKLLSQQMLYCEFYNDADNYNNYVLKFQETSCEVFVQACKHKHQNQKGETRARG